MLCLMVITSLVFLFFAIVGSSLFMVKTLKDLLDEENKNSDLINLCLWFLLICLITVNFLGIEYFIYSINYLF